MASRSERRLLAAMPQEAMDHARPHGAADTLVTRGGRLRETRDGR